MYMQSHTNYMLCVWSACTVCVKYGSIFNYQRCVYRVQRCTCSVQKLSVVICLYMIGLLEVYWNIVMHSKSILACIDKNDICVFLAILLLLFLKQLTGALRNLSDAPSLRGEFISSGILPRLASVFSDHMTCSDIVFNISRLLRLADVPCVSLSLKATQIVIKDIANGCSFYKCLYQHFSVCVSLSVCSDLCNES